MTLPFIFELKFELVPLLASTRLCSHIHSILNYILILILKWIYSTYIHSIYM